MGILEDVTGWVRLSEVVLRMITRLSMAHIQQVDLVDVKVLNDVNLRVLILMVLISFVFQKSIVGCMCM
jgi:hypothetical protein